MRKKAAPKKLDSIRNSPEVKHSIQQLENEVKEAVAEAVAYYLKSPDTLRQLVRSEIGRMGLRGVNNLEVPSELLSALTRKAQTMAADELRLPENRQALLDALKNKYIAEYRKEAETIVSHEAYTDAHRVYSGVLHSTTYRRK